ncbi:unnamed protein product [Discosporangium mesarthrocarpum]
MAGVPALAGSLASLQAALAPVLTEAQRALEGGAALSPENAQALVVAAVVTAASAPVLLAFKAFGFGENREGPPLPTTYDLEAIMSYYNSRPLTLLTRLSSVSFSLGSLAFKLWVDRQGDGSGWERNMPDRAAEFYNFVQGAGPAFIKVGQGVSIRPDILPEPYLQELVKLQDQVPPFSSEEAKAILSSELGRPLSQVFSDADTAFVKPIAAASLGQVS